MAYLSWMHSTKRRTFNRLSDFIGQNILKSQNPVIFCLADSFVSMHAVVTEVFHAIQAALCSLSTIFTVCAFCWVLYGQDC